MLGDYARWRKALGATVGDAYSKLLAKTFTHVNNMSYDKRFVASLSETWASVAGSPALQRSYAGRLADPSSDADFVAAMRLVATAGLKPGEDPAALASWADADFLGFEKTGGKPSKSSMKVFNMALLQYDEAKAAWQKANEPSAAETPAVTPPPAPAAPSAPGPIG